MNLLRIIFPPRQTRRAAELAYLNGSANRYDLEQRQREIDQGRFAEF